MIDGGSCENIISKTTFEKMGLKTEPHSHPYNVNWADKTAQSITQHCQILIHTFGFQDRVWCDVLDVNTAHILLGRSWLYNLNMTSPDRSNTYKFKFKGKKISVKIYQAQAEYEK